MVERGDQHVRVIASTTLSTSTCAGGRPISSRSNSLRSRPRLIAVLPDRQCHTNVGMRAPEWGDDRRRNVLARADDAETTGAVASKQSRYLSRPRRDQPIDIVGGPEQFPADLRWA